LNTLQEIEAHTGSIKHPIQNYYFGAFLVTLEYQFGAKKIKLEEL
jgi:hypothetical protein